MPAQKEIKPRKVKVFFSRIKNIVRTLASIIFTRRTFANILMTSFILCTSIGAALLQGPALGLIVAGVSSGIFGFLLGLE
jgi:hypothetical protein